MSTAVSGSMDITLDDASPTIVYNGSWSQDHAADPEIDSYFYRTFHGTTTQNDTATIAFNGTGITIYGAKRSNHGNYQVQIDSQTPMGGISGTGNDQFQQVLYTTTSLTDGPHTLVLTNMPRDNTTNWLDLDYAVIHRTAPSGLANAQFTTQTFDDGDSPFTYAGTWSGNPIDPPQPPFYHDSTAHINDVVGNTATLTFTGDSVALYGGLYSDHGEYQATLDGKLYPKMNGTVFPNTNADSTIMAGQTLFFASGLGQSQHSLVITNLGNGPRGGYLDIDYAVVNSTWSASSTSASTTITQSSTSAPSGSGSAADAATNTRTSSHAGAIAGGVVGGVLGLALIALLLWFLLFRRRRNVKYGAVGDHRGGNDGMVDLAAASGAGPASGAVGAGVGAYASSSRHEQAGSPYAHQAGQASDMWGGSSQGYTEYATNLSRGGPGDTIGPYGVGSPVGNHGGPTPYLSAVPPPPASSATSYPGGSVAGDTHPYPNPHDHGITPFTSAAPAHAPVQPGAMPGNVKQMGVALPFTARPVPPPPAHAASEPRSDAASVNSGSQGFQHNVLSPSTSSEMSVTSPQSGRMQRMGREVDAGPYVPPHSSA